MTETRVGFLYNAASSLLSVENSQTQTLLRSYYLTRCREISKTAVLAPQYFSSKLRCPDCGIEWQKGMVNKLRKRQLSKQAKRRLRRNSLREKETNCEKELFYNKELVQVCTFCKHSTITPLIKLEKDKITKTFKINKRLDEKFKNKVKIETQVKERKPAVNVYATSMDIFSLKNKDNTLSSATQIPVKVIKNNKKKKDKFAGLCQQAVLASAKLKDEQKKQNKLNLFLKPSS